MSKRKHKLKRQFKTKTKITPLIIDEKRVNLVTFCGFKRVKGSWDQLWTWDDLQDVSFK